MFLAASTVLAQTTEVVGRWNVCLGAYETERAAAAEIVRLEAMGIGGLAVEPNASRFRVVVGPFDTRDEAAAWRDEARNTALSADAFLTASADEAAPAKARAAGATALMRPSSLQRSVPPAVLEAAPAPVLQQEYFVQAALVSSRGAANDLMKRVGGRGGLVEETSDGKFRVLVGPYPYYIDALLIKDDFIECGAALGAFVVVRTKGYGPAAAAPPTPRQRFGQARTTGRNPMQVIEERMQRIQAPEEQLQRLARPTDHPTSPSDAHARTRAAVATGDRAEALKLQSSLAAGYVAGTTAKDEIQATYDAARSLHALGDRVEAYRAYGESHARTADATLKRRATVERIALMMELAESGKGSMEEFRHAAWHAIAATGTDTLPELKDRAILELMYGESFVKEGRESLAVEPLRHFIAKYQGVPTLRREIAEACFAQGVALYRSNQIEESKESFILALATELRHEENWADSLSPVDARAAEWLCWIANQRNQLPELQTWAAYLSAKHPEVPEAHRVQEWIQDLERRLPTLQEGIQ